MAWQSITQLPENHAHMQCIDLNRRRVAQNLIEIGQQRHGRSVLAVLTLSDPCGSVSGDTLTFSAITADSSADASRHGGRGSHQRQRGQCHRQRTDCRHIGGEHQSQHHKASLRAARCRCRAGV